MASNLAPTFTQKPTLKQDGTKVVFTAEVEAKPKPTIVWYRNDVKLDPGPRIKALMTDVPKAMNKFKLTLTLQTTTDADYGTYKVEAKNAAGKKPATVNFLGEDI